MRILLKENNKSYTVEKFDSEKGIIHLKNTNKTTTKDNIKEFLYVSEDEKELKELILNFSNTTESIIEVTETKQVIKPKATRAKSKAC